MHAVAYPATQFARVLAVCAVSATLAFNACASAGGMAASAQSVEGCYFFQHDDASTSMRLPVGVRLTDRGLEGWPAIMERGDVKVAVTLTRNGEADYPFGYWLSEVTGIEVGYPAGGGIVLDLSLSGGVLEGTARALGDAFAAGQEGAVREIDVRLERGACP